MAITVHVVRLILGCTRLRSLLGCCRRWHVHLCHRCRLCMHRRCLIASRCPGHPGVSLITPTSTNSLPTLWTHVVLWLTHGGSWLARDIAGHLGAGGNAGGNRCSRRQRHLLARQAVVRLIGRWRHLHLRCRAVSSSCSRVVCWHRRSIGIHLLLTHHNNGNVRLCTLP